MVLWATKPPSMITSICQTGAKPNNSFRVRIPKVGTQGERMAFRRVAAELEHERPEDWEPGNVYCGWGCKICGRAFKDKPGPGRPRTMCHSKECLKIYNRKMLAEYRLRGASY